MAAIANYDESRRSGKIGLGMRSSAIRSLLQRPINDQMNVPSSSIALLLQAILYTTVYCM